MKYLKPEITFYEFELEVKNMADKYGSCDGKSPLCFKDMYK